MSPFQALYVTTPLSIPAYIKGSSPIQTIVDTLHNRDNLLQQLKKHLMQAQNQMKQLANRKRWKVIFKPRDLVIVKLQPYRQSLIAKCLNTQLCRQYFGPFLIVAIAGSVAYTL